MRVILEESKSAAEHLSLLLKGTLDDALVSSVMLPPEIASVLADWAQRLLRCPEFRDTELGGAVANACALLFHVTRSAERVIGWADDLQRDDLIRMRTRVLSRPSESAPGVKHDG